MTVDELKVLLDFVDPKLEVWFQDRNGGDFPVTSGGIEHSDPYDPVLLLVSARV